MIADEISKASESRIQIELFGAGELVAPLDVFNAVAEGSADIYHSAEYYFTDKSPALAFFASVPFGMTATEMNTWLNFGGGQQLWDEISAEFGIKSFMAGNSGTQAGGWFNKEIITLDDFKEMRVRVPGLGGQALARLGAEIVDLAGGDIFQALQSGTIDAAEWSGPWTDSLFGFQKISPFYYTVGFHEPGTGFSMGFNRAVWEGLSAADQAMISAIIAKVDALTYQTFLSKNGPALDVLRDEGVTLREFSSSVWDGFGKASIAVLRELDEADPRFRKVHESYAASRRNVAGWLNRSERKYLESRNRILGL
jgi:TRAP-type mannitol/chloroaromatic compound transport system substrate-binding protein